MLTKLVHGAASGALATVALAAVSLAGDQAGLMRDQPSRHVTPGGLPLRASRTPLTPGLPPRTSRTPLTSGMAPGAPHASRHGGRRTRRGEALAHFGIGVASGVVFSTLSRGRRARLPLGVGYALAAWIASHNGWVPCIGILPPETRDDSCRAAVTAAGHVVYGMVLVATMNRLLRQPSPPV
ncbi:hypothetical protein IMZ11_02095 [Microtetraspora sp. AC03309]|uniref:hypothetical protein n=1 Tax=Microtetraspora sp. AC03309 TaxID=2779376 RepID=UPI001E36841C|nr:hypothetical protein [Microtetraspora sp. AC03309]MCC5574431.1 hypothetical protein [Microtetraspora sp. AC03309]